MLCLIFRRADTGLSMAEKLAMAYGLGIGFISLEMLALSLLKMRFTFFNIAAPWLVILIANVILLSKKAPGHSIKPDLSAKDDSKILVLKIVLQAGIALEIFYAFFRALIKPIESYDAVAIYAIKSKIFYLAGIIPSDYFTALAKHFPHPDYPLNIPLIETFIYLTLASLNDALVKIVFPLYFIGTLAMLYFAVRRFANSNYALIFTFMLATIPQFNAYACNAYIDLPLAFYCFTSAIFLFEYFRDRTRIHFMVLSAVMAALAGWTKNEGLMYCAAYIVTMIIYFAFNLKKSSVKDIISALLYVIIIAAISVPWLLIKKIFGLVNNDMGLMDMSPASLVNNIYKLGPIFYEFQKELFGPKKWNIFWAAAACIFIIRIKAAFSGHRRYVTITLFLIISGYVLAYMVSPIDIRFFLAKTWSRFLVQFLPIAVYWLALMLKDDIDL